MLWGLWLNSGTPCLSLTLALICSHEINALASFYIFFLHWSRHISVATSPRFFPPSIQYAHFRFPVTTGYATIFTIPFSFPVSLWWSSCVSRHGKRSYSDVTVSLTISDWFGLQARRTLVVSWRSYVYGPPLGSHRHRPKSSSGAILRLCSSLRLGEHPLHACSYWDGNPQLSGAGPSCLNRVVYGWYCHFPSITKKQGLFSH